MNPERHATLYTTNWKTIFTKFIAILRNEEGQEYLNYFIEMLEAEDFSPRERAALEEILLPIE